MHGQQLRDHIAKQFSETFQEYREYADIPKREAARYVKAIRRWKLDEVEDWFFVMDALGRMEERDQHIEEFYKLAETMWYCQIEST